MPRLAVTPVSGATVGVLGPRGVALLRQEAGEVEGGMRMAAPVRPPVRRLRVGQLPLLVEQYPQVRCSVGAPAPLGSLEGRRGATQVAPAGEQHTERQGRFGILEQVPPPVGRLGSVEILTSLERSPHVESGSGGDRFGRRTLLERRGRAGRAGAQPSLRRLQREQERHGDQLAVTGSSLHLAGQRRGGSVRTPRSQRFRHYQRNRRYAGRDQQPVDPAVRR
jgi:hypothetical protein